MRIAVIGASGLVGRKMIEVLFERNFPFTELLVAASDRSAGRKINVANRQFTLWKVEEILKSEPDAVLFSAGAEPSLEWAPKFAEQGVYVIDNSSAWRMHNNIKLIVPEVNAETLNSGDKIIANPNCSTIQLVVALAPLHKRYKIRRVVISTYQSVSGTGMKAINQLENERLTIEGEMVYPYKIDLNCIPHGGKFLEDGYTTEEIKLVLETRKILGDDSIQVSPTVVRIPVKCSHSESVNLEFEKPIELNEIRQLLSKSPGIILQDEPGKNIYPMPLYAEGKDEVFVGRLRIDNSQPNSMNMWIVADNLRKGAATNAIQILEYLLKRKFISF